MLYKVVIGDKSFGSMGTGAYVGYKGHSHSWYSTKLFVSHCKACGCSKVVWLLGLCEIFRTDKKTFNEIFKPKSVEGKIKE